MQCRFHGTASSLPASGGRTVRLWDVKTKETIAIFNTVGTIHKLSFSNNGSHLERNQGVLQLKHATHCDSRFRFNSICPLYVKEHWITWGTKNILWLPPDYRSSCVAIHQNILAIGLASGRVIFTELDLDTIPLDDGKDDEKRSGEEVEEGQAELLF